MQLSIIFSNNLDIPKMKKDATYAEILEHLKQPQNGIGFFTHNPSLPNQTFVSADAVQWLNNYIDGGVDINRAIDIMQVHFTKNEFSFH